MLVRLRSPAVLSFLAVTLLASGASLADEPELQPLFDGVTLTGWQGDLAGYEVADG